MLVMYQIIIAILVLIIFYLYRKSKNNVWKKLGIFYLPGLPIFGNDIRFAFGLETNVDSQKRKYNRIGNHKFAGTHMFAIPFFFPKDPDLVENILIKDFTNFYDRGIPNNEKTDPLQAHLFNLSGKRWKHLRQKLSPVFTSGKLKTMHHILIECADVLMQVIDNYSITGESCNFKDTIAKYTTDVIGSCAYGLNINSLKDDDNEFRKMGSRVFETSIRVKIRTLMRQLLRTIHPNLVERLNIKIMPKELDDFFINLVKDTIKLRESDPKYVRNDFVQLIINLKKEDDVNAITGKPEDTENNENVVIDYKIMAANSFLFFVAGFETTASTISYCLFELSINQELQERVHEEIVNVLSQFEGVPTYDAIKKMHLLNMVVSETLRKYPPAPFLFRVCTEPYRIPDTDVVIPKGTRVEIPVYSIQRDPNIYHDPEEFIPDRFSPENINKIPKGAYLPFGDGPRVCIGVRFAQMEIKVCLSKILTKYIVKKSSKMSDQIKFDPKSMFLMIPKGGIWMDVEKR